MSFINPLRSISDHSIREISEEFERRIAEYEEEISRLKKENCRQRKKLDAIYKPEVRIYRLDYERARRKAKRAETTNCLNSESDSMLGRFNQIRHSNSRYTEYQSSSEEDIGLPPQKHCVPIPPSPPASPSSLSQPAAPAPPAPPAAPAPPAPPTPPLHSRRQTITPTERHIISQLENLKEEVAVIKQLLLSRNSRTSPAAVLPEGIHLPMGNLQDLNKVETMLKEEACYSEVAKYLATLGGANASSNTRWILVRLLTTPLAQQLCWRGSGQKLAFGDMLVCRAVIDAVTRSCQATAFEVEAAIKLWLRNARDRDGGRSRRSKK
ncbi:protein diaphanous homolog 1 isoform X2 [Lampris incognitus]|uniref:protein diaphanous homolog 1 isoform X2 n=1 Tax=Lampris incognitus TaxID=2546036 RepID=UPI0024B4DFE6|nr:protein diaphanous homolog 1 isoform X2 [Lampris incognitus]